MNIWHLPGGDEVYHYKKSIVVMFAGGRRVLSTGPDNGGIRDDLDAVFNNDANPGPGMTCIMRAPTFEGHMNILAKEDLGLDPERCTGLMTAASMENLSIKTMSYDDFTVSAIVTGGIANNAGRAGDPATWHEDGATTCTPLGTINIILHIDADLPDGTLARALVTCTEAKTAAISELMAPSLYSSGIATGSGTDGVIIVCNPQAKMRLTNAGKHSKLGELIGKCVKSAVREALSRQSGLTPKYQHDILQRMGRYGATQDRLWELSCGSVTRAAFTDALDRVRYENSLVVCAALYAHILDELSWGLLGAQESYAAGMKILNCALERYGSSVQAGDVTAEVLINPDEKRPHAAYMMGCEYDIKSARDVEDINPKTDAAVRGMADIFARSIAHMVEKRAAGTGT